MTLSELTLLRDKYKFYCNVYYGLDDRDILIRRENKQVLRLIEDCIAKKLKAREKNAAFAKRRKERNEKEQKGTDRNEKEQKGTDRNEKERLKFLLWGKK